MLLRAEINGVRGQSLKQMDDSAVAVELSLAVQELDRNDYNSLYWLAAVSCEHAERLRNRVGREHAERIEQASAEAASDPPDTDEAPVEAAS